MIALGVVLALPFLIVLLPASLQLTTLGACPSADAVRSRLDALVSPEDADGRSAILESSASGLRIVLAGRDGSVDSQRIIPADRPCDELAQMAALVLASWLSDLSSRGVPVERLPHLTSVAVPPEATSRSWSWEVALGATGSFDGTLAPGVLLQLETGPSRARWSLGALVGYDGLRQAAEGPGAVNWQRLEGGLGALYALLRGPYRLEVGGDLLLSDILLRGLNFPTTASAASLSPGLGLAVRVSLLKGHWHPWVGVWGDLWMREELPTVRGLSLQSALPQVEAFAGIGISWQSAERF